MPASAPGLLKAGVIAQNGASQFIFFSPFSSQSSLRTHEFDVALLLGHFILSWNTGVCLVNEQTGLGQKA